MLATRRRQIVRRAAMALAVVVLLLNGYVGSYPVALKLQTIQAAAVPGGRPDRWISVYAPLEQLIDDSSVGPAILKCADVCGPEVRSAQVRRIIERSGTDRRRSGR